MDHCVRPKRHAFLSLDLSQLTNNDYDDEFDIPDPAPSPEAICLENATAQEVSRAICRLPACQRRVMDLYYAESKSYQEICVETGLPMGTVKSRLSRARHLLHDRLVASGAM